MDEVRWLDEQEHAAWLGFLRAHARLSAELARRLAADSSLSYPDYEVLAVLTAEPDGRMRAFALADTLGWERSRLSHQVSRMAARGLVEKVRCESDRRGWFVVITPAGRDAIEAAAPGHVAAVRELFVDRLSPDQLDAIATIADNVLDG